MDSRQQPTRSFTRGRGRYRGPREWSSNKSDAAGQGGGGGGSSQASARNNPPKQTWRERKPDSSKQESSEAATTQPAVPKEPGVPRLVQELQEKLHKGDVECMICYDAVGRSAPVWSCSSCYSIFHLNCTRKWARTPASTDRSASRVDENWRCPGCQAIQFTPAGDLRYWCFCGAEPEPPVDYYITPHSCGGPCRKPLDKSKTGECEHLCTLQCHPGPCPPCTGFAAPESCGCGRVTVTRRCSEKDGSVVCCGELCGRMFSCGRHECQRTCHGDECGKCKAMVTVTCFCQRKREVLACGLIEVAGELTSSGVFSCDSACSKLLSCGDHSCTKRCHPGDCGGCEFSPSKVVTCPCGKGTLKELLGNGKGRRSCLDPIPTCGRVCERLMSCGSHFCESNCHVGACPPCEVLVEQKCRCGGSSRFVPCSTATAKDSRDEFVCEKTCGRKRTCGRHRCNSKCCSPSDDHICMLDCGKKLRCGVHVCQELCHKGHCQPCLQSGFTDLTCACGKTSIPPPVPCGTPTPRCELPCSVRQPCGHAATHSCHFGECPPCVVPVVKECVGNHTLVRNVPCGSKEIKCHQQCGKLRKCGVHLCGRTCHSGPCDEQNDGGLSCGQACGASRAECIHTCVARCHPSEPCPNTRCSFTVTITCNCERLSAPVPCDTGGTSAGETILPSLPPLQPVHVKERVPLSQRKIACDDECYKAQKLKGLAEALGIRTTASDALASYGPSDILQEMAKKDSQFITAVEDRFRYLLLGPKSVACSTGLRVHAFCPLPKEKRDVIYQLAQRWNLSVSNVGWEPKRYMLVHVNSKSRMPGHPSKATVPAPVFSPYLDVDPKQVVGLLDLPREGDISGLVLRFGGECELIWLNDRNALAIFADPARAATAMKRVDHATSYPGAFYMPPRNVVTYKAAGWGMSSASQSSPASQAWKSPPRSEPGNRSESGAWDQPVRGVWQKRKPTLVSNPFTALEDGGSSGSGSGASMQNGPAATAGGANRSSSSSSSSGAVTGGNVDNSSVVDDWETACE